MNEGNEFDDLRQLDSSVLSEIVREGEARVQAQLAAAIAADQRAMTLAGFQVTAATGALAGGVALVMSRQGDLTLAALAIAFSAAILSATWIALLSVRPSQFDFPGNDPRNWLPNRWSGHQKHRLDLVQARVEQASCLSAMIRDNSKAATKMARRVHLSMDITLWSVAVAGLTLTLYVIAKANFCDFFLAGV